MSSGCEVLHFWISECLLKQSSLF